MRTKTLGCKHTGNLQRRRQAAPWFPAWHPLLIAAADQGGQRRLFASLAAEEELDQQARLDFKVDRHGEYGHPAYRRGRPAAAAAAAGAASPFPLVNAFGLLPYAAFRGHQEVVAGFAAAGFDPAGTGRVS